jgi:hypothetical protein
MFAKIRNLANELNARVSTSITMLMWELEAQAEAHVKTLNLKAR